VEDEAVDGEQYLGPARYVDEDADLPRDQCERADEDVAF